MSSGSDKPSCDQGEMVSLYLLRVLGAGEITVAETHIAACSQCQGQIKRLQPVIDSLDAWPTELLGPSESVWQRLAHRIAGEKGAKPLVLPPQPWQEPTWEEVGPGISCKVLSTDTERDRLSMLVRLARGAAYPPHTHAGVEELHLLYGELWIDDRKLYPGDYHRAEPGTTERRVWSETGCTCVLMTSSRDFIL